ncbi:MAG: DUF4129 domain-containing protein [Catenulispora sp.]|nr:DUF4129 domain-containing protein [Catenulispora sp.]
MIGNPKRWVPTVVVVLAVAALSVAARRPGGLDNGTADGLWKQARPAVALLSVVALVMVAVTFAKHRDDGYGLLRRAGAATAVVLVAAAVFTPLGLLFFGRESPQALPPSPFQQDPTGSPDTSGTDTPPRNIKHAAPVHGTTISEWVARVVLFLVLLAAVVLIGYLLYRLLRNRRLPRAALAVLEFGDLPEADLEQLADAIAAGSEALAYQGDAREAVIACYAAMEQALTADGHGRRSSDTTEDFLQRVTGARLIPAAPARRLTELFREARFSRHPIAESKREEARVALATISEHLRARAAAAAETAQAAGAAASAGVGGGTGPAPSGGPR